MVQRCRQSRRFADILVPNFMVNAAEVFDDFNNSVIGVFRVGKYLLMEMVVMALSVCLWHASIVCW
jgi:hypothetical protein